MNKKSITFVALIICILILSSCSTKKNIMYSKKKVPSGSSIAVIIDCPNNAKNIVLTEFMRRKFIVKAVNASDLYTMNEIFDIKDFKKVSYNSSLKNDSLQSMEKTYDNLYKLHVYNFEINKAGVLAEMKEKWNVEYLLILDLRDWESVSWGRAIDLENYELIWVENYATEFHDNIETIINHFITSLTGR